MCVRRRRHGRAAPCSEAATSFTRVPRPCVLSTVWPMARVSRPFRESARHDRAPPSRQVGVHAPEGTAHSKKGTSLEAFPLGLDGAQHRHPCRLRRRWVVRRAGTGPTPLALTGVAATGAAIGGQSGRSEVQQRHRHGDLERRRQLHHQRHRGRPALRPEDHARQRPGPLLGGRRHRQQRHREHQPGDASGRRQPDGRRSGGLFHRPSTPPPRRASPTPSVTAAVTAVKTTLLAAGVDLGTIDVLAGTLTPATGTPPATPTTRRWTCSRPSSPPPAPR